jgi:transposase
VTSARHSDGSTSRRRTPTQRRSRERVERILDVAAELITEYGVAGLSTRAIATRADVPVASLYQYFADKEEIVLARHPRRHRGHHLTDPRNFLYSTVVQPTRCERGKPR